MCLMDIYIARKDTKAVESVDTKPDEPKVSLLTRDFVVLSIIVSPNIRHIPLPRCM